MDETKMRKKTYKKKLSKMNTAKDNTIKHYESKQSTYRQ